MFTKLVHFNEVFVMSIDLKNSPDILNPERNYLDCLPTVDSNIPYDEFFKQYLLPNQACIIKNITRDWNCVNKWILNGTLNYNYLYTQYGENTVTVYDCEKKHYNSQETKDMQFMHYLTYLEAYTEAKYSEKFPILYLKDWHLMEQQPHDDFYHVPEYFKSDWLNEYLIHYVKDDYRFVYIGPKGSWTPFHADVFKSFSWSANVHGKKRWVLLPPGQEELLKDNLGNLPYDIANLKDKVKHFEIIQNTGDAIFVPSGWYHQVWNLETTISINHNWFNGCNIDTVWLDLESHLKSVFKEIDDCRGMDGFLEQAQLVLKASYGLDFQSFFDIIKYISEQRIKMIDCDMAREMGKTHAIFDLERILNVLGLFIASDDVKRLDSLQDLIVQSDLYNRICNCIKNDS